MLCSRPCAPYRLNWMKMRPWRCSHLRTCCRQSQMLQAWKRWNGFQMRAMLLSSGVPWKCALTKDCCSCRPQGAGRGPARASCARGSTCACCPPALDLVSSPATNNSLAKTLVRIDSPPISPFSGRVELDDPANRDPRRRLIPKSTSCWVAPTAQQNLPRRLQ